MMEKLKGWLINVAIKKFGPSAVRGAILGLGGFLAAKEGLLSTFGIVYDKASHILTVIWMRFRSLRWPVFRRSARASSKS